MNETESYQFLEETKKYGSVLGLESIRALMEELGNVQDRILAVHIAGTNGKGSVGAMLASVLQCAGYRVGRFSTPDVFCYEEEFTINAVPITKKRLAQLFTRVKAACDRLVSEGKPHPTRFEVETAAAFLWFYEEPCDIALIEVGMGGETDATNVLAHPLLSVLTSISMDHMQYLGDTIDEIAAVKAGIIKEGVPVVCAPQQESVSALIRKRCRECRAPFVPADPSTLYALTRHEGTYSFRSPLQLVSGRCDIPVSLSLKGAFQVDNALCVIRVLEVLSDQYPNITADSVREGLSHTVWRGRMEQISADPDFFIDGAHNEDAILRLKQTLRESFSDRRIVYIMGVLADKAYRRMAELMFEPGDLVLTVTPPNARALSGERLAKVLSGQKIDARYCENIKDAVSYALHAAGEQNAMILAFGSLSYLKEIAGDLNEICEQAPGRSGI